jgi:hypothetical protein
MPFLLILAAAIGVITLGNRSAAAATPALPPAPKPGPAPTPVKPMPAIVGERWWRIAVRRRNTGGSLVYANFLLTYSTAQTAASTQAAVAESVGGDTAVSLDLWQGAESPLGSSFTAASAWQPVRTMTGKGAVSPQPPAGAKWRKIGVVSDPIPTTGGQGALWIAAIADDDLEAMLAIVTRLFEPFRAQGYRVSVYTAKDPTAAAMPTPTAEHWTKILDVPSSSK